MNRAVVIEKKLDTGHVTSILEDREYTTVVSQIAAYQHPMNQSSNRLFRVFVAKSSCSSSFNFYQYSKLTLSDSFTVDTEYSLTNEFPK